MDIFVDENKDAGKKIVEKCLVQLINADPRLPRHNEQKIADLIENSLYFKKYRAIGRERRKKTQRKKARKLALLIMKDAGWENLNSPASW